MKKKKRGRRDGVVRRRDRWVRKTVGGFRKWARGPTTGARWDQHWFGAGVSPQLGALEVWFTLPPLQLWGIKVTFCA